jgi:hypothetical protein
VRRWLEIEVGRNARRAVLHSIPHRLPRAVVVPIGVAARLAATGVPLVLRRVADDDGRVA